MKKILILAVAMVMLFSVSASAITVAFSQIGQESDWRTANTDNIKAAIDAEGWTYVYDDAQQRQENQVKALRNFISQNVDYILFTGVVSTGWGEVLKEVNESEIPLILVDRMPDNMDEIEYAAAFGGDFVEEGRRMALWTANYVKKLGLENDELNMVILEGTTGADAATGRQEGITEILADYPNLKVIASQTGNFTRAEGQTVMESFLKAHDKIDILLAHNDDMALGAIESIKAAALVPGKDIIIVGCDAPKTAFDAILAGEMNATIECTPLYGPFVVDAIKRLEAGEDLGRELMHPEESCFDAEGGIVYSLDGRVSEKAADKIGERVY
ncbi:MAG: ABC transporter substrate-binding protein [Eubacteriales bacterium]|nr:ABC transporter substrate-binding protein [Eubacteriales bacterium]